MLSFFGPGGTTFFPRFPPAPSPPRGVKGSLNSQFGFFGLDRGVGARGCGAGLGATSGERICRSQWDRVWFGYSSINGAARASGRACSGARSAQMRVQGERSERAHAPPSPLGRAEQRSGARIRAGACLSVASLRTTPGDASSARYPKGARPLARLFFGYFLLAKQKKVTRPTGRNRYSKPRPAGRNLYKDLTPGAKT
jgi:hypothetical protein